MLDSETLAEMLEIYTCYTDLPDCEVAVFLYSDLFLMFRAVILCNSCPTEIHKKSQCIIMHLVNRRVLALSYFFA